MDNNKQVSILYVNDEQLNLELFKINFKNHYFVHTALSGHEGLDKLHNIQDISVVISDMRMPGINGIEFIKLARKNFSHIAYFNRF